MWILWPPPENFSFQSALPGDCDRVANDSLKQTRCKYFLLTPDFKTYHTNNFVLIGGSSASFAKISRLL
jgi:hypothetical protein